MANGNADWLLVPMEVSALTVGTNAAKSVWTDLSPDYSNIYQNFALAGPDLVKLFPPSKPLAAGVHLNWYLPEAFGRRLPNGTQDLAYPIIPNRWLIRRIRYTPNTCTIAEIAAWMVESDFLYNTQADGGEPGTVSVLLDRPKLFDSMGKATPVQGNWTEANPSYRFTLTALGPGGPDFPAYYPACRSVLGFHDPNPGHAAPGDWQVSYLVTGWYSDPTRDVLAVDPKTLGQRLAQLEWSLPDGKPPANPIRSLCHGAVTRVSWNAASPHAANVPSPQAATLYAGNSLAEALSTLLAKRLQPNNSAALEPLLAAFQYDMLGSGDQIDDLAAELHRRRFSSFPGSERYSIHAKRNSDAAPGQPGLALNLPADIEDALYDLNVKARQAGRRQRELGSRQQTLFTAWHLWAWQYTGQLTTVRAPELDSARTAVSAAADAAVTAETAHQAARVKLDTDLSLRLPDLELAQSTELPFYRAADPTVLIAGKGFSPSGVYQPPLGDADLPCRRLADVITGISAPIPNAGTQTAAVKDLFPKLPASPALSAGPSTGTLDALLGELLILDPVALGSKQDPPVADFVITAMKAKASIVLAPGDLAALKSQTLALLRQDPNFPSNQSFTSSPTSPATIPAQVAMLRWTANPWRPLLLAWEVKWHPDPTLAGTAALPGSWQPWPLDAAGNEFQLPNPAPSQANTFIYRSYTMLTPHPEWVLRRRLEEYQKKTGQDLSAVLTKISTLEVLAQSLGGFHDALRQLRHGLQLPPVNPAYVLADAPAQNPKWADVQDPLYCTLPPNPLHMHAPILPSPAPDFQPIRAGRLEFSKLWLVDSFGQTCALTNLGAPVTLPPRYAQPARLNFQWLSTDPGHPGATPLCGWIFPNYLDKSLMICDASGKLWGALQKVIRVDLSGGTGALPDPHAIGFFWVPVPGDQATPMDIADAGLRAFVNNLLKMTADAVTSFLDSMAVVQADSGAAPEHDPRLSILVGKPLALARASIAIEIMGLPIQAAIPPATPKIPAPAGDPTRGFTGVSFPMRLGGSPAGAPEGLAGFFVDGANVFYPRYGLTGADYSGTLEHNHALSLNAAGAVQLTLLLDPSLPVHARCGLLPVYSFTLPESVAAGVSSIRDVFFQSAPLLGPPGTPRVPPPSDDYGQWSWAARPRVTFWQEYPEIADPGDRGGFAQSPVELREGWLKLVMNPVNIGAFWVKDAVCSPGKNTGAVTVARGARVTLGWTLDGADSLALSVKDAPGTLQSWTKRSDSNLPLECQLQIDKDIQLSLTALDRRGNRSVKSLRLEVAQT